MDDLPSAVFGPKDSRNPQSDGGNFRSPADLRLVPLDFHEARDIGGDVRRDGVERNCLAIAIDSGRAFHHLRALLPSPLERAEWVPEAYVVALGIHPFQGLGVPFHELAKRGMRFIDSSGEVVGHSHRNSSLVTVQ